MKFRSSSTGYKLLLRSLLAAMVVTAGWCAPLWADHAKPLRVALLPILDAFPYYVAESAGYFDRNGVEVQAVPVASGLERDQLMQSGEIDGMLNEMMSTASFNREGVKVRIVSVARKAYPDYPLFRILSAPGKGIDTPAKMAGASVAVSKNTIIEYVTDRLLESEGLSLDTIKMRSVPVIPERYQLLMQGQISCAVLPDPLAKSAMTAGALLVVDDARYPRFAVSVLTFGLRSLEHRADDVRGFLKAWDQAVADINAQPEKHRDLLLEKIRVPKNIQGTYKIPPYPRKEIPNPSQWSDVMSWMVAKKLLSAPLAYEPSVTDAFLP